MKKLEEAIIYATIMHQGKVRKMGEVPYILHPLEVSHILSTMTDDEDVITAGILHDIVEDTDGTLAEIEKRFGKRVAELVDSESENKYPDENPSDSWKRRKEESLNVLSNSSDEGVQMLWLADKLANIRSLSGAYSEKGEAMWQSFHQSDPELQCWYYKSVGEMVELTLNKTGAFKEYIKHINFIWPGTFEAEKTKYRKYREVSVDGCKRLGYGAKGEVYRYDDELVIKVYNQNNTYRDVEEEIAKSRKAFILGIPTAISFGIVSVGKQYGAMYELVEADTLSEMIAKNPGHVEAYAKIMASLSREIHSITVSDDDGFPPAAERLEYYVHGGLEKENEKLAKKYIELIRKLSDTKTLVHGDFHTDNVFLQNGEPLLIDMDRISYGHPIAEISDFYYFYVVLGENDPEVVEKFMGFDYQTAIRFFDLFLQYYMDTTDEGKLQEVKKKASVLCYIRMINKLYKNNTLYDDERILFNYYMTKIIELSDEIDSLEF